MRLTRNALAFHVSLTVTLVAPVLSVASGAAPAAQGAAAPATAGPAKAPVDPLSEYKARCPAGAEPSLDCEWLRGLVVAELVETLEVIERSRDQRGVGGALAALEVLDEPLVLIAACRVLGNFADTPEIARKVPPLLDSPYLEVQRIAAQLLSRNPDGALASMGGQWIQNHAGATVATPYDELDFPEHYDSMKFPEYPGVERYTPVDSDRSIGWWTSDPPSTVASRLGKTLSAAVMTYDQWMERAGQQMMSAFDPEKMEKKMEEMQKLVEQYTKTQDEKLMQRIEALQQEVSSSSEQADADMQKAVDSVATPPGIDLEEIRYLVAEEKAGHVARLVIVYRQPVLERTVVQMAWDLRDYPPAWKEGGEEP